jgi:uncharacterized LabA/DUF88 family protein
MAYGTRLFIDFWNFSLNWRDRVKKVNGHECDWTKLPGAILKRSELIFATLGDPTALQLDETLVYASVEAGKDAKLIGWLDNFLDRQPSFRVVRRERHSRPFEFHCRECGAVTRDCPACAKRLRRAVEKGVDTAIVTDLLSLAWQDAFNVAVLLSSDADFIPAVVRIQEKGLKVINVSWAQHGHELKKACWAAFDLDEIAPQVCR